MSGTLNNNALAQTTLGGGQTPDSSTTTTAMVNAPLDQLVVAAVQAFIMSVLGLAMTQVVTSNENGVPEPLDDFVMISRLAHRIYALPRITYDNVSVETVNQSMDYPFQLDFYGPGSADKATIVHALFKTEIATTFFEAFGVTNNLTIEPLYAEEARYTAIINEESQYEQRWTAKVHVNVIFSIATPQQFLTTAPTVDIINVPRTYHL
jgi:hypothetical protein